MPFDETSAFRKITREALEPVWMRETISLQRIADTLGVSRNGLIDKARRLGLPPRGPAYDRTRKCPDEEFRRAWLAGVKTDDMARAFGYRASNGVSQRRKRLGLPRRPPGPRADAISWREFVEMELAREIEAEHGR